MGCFCTDSVSNAQTAISGLRASPDGKRVAFGIRAPDSLPGPERYLSSIDLESKRVKLFSTLKGQGPEIHYGASWSPDSNDLAFTFVTGPMNVPPEYFERLINDLVAGRVTECPISFELFLGSANTGQACKILGGDMCLWQYPRFSPTGKKLLAREAHTHNVALVDLATKKHSFLLPMPEEAFTADTYRFGYDWHPDGRIVYISVGNDREKESGIWRVDTITGVRSRLNKTYRAYALFVSASGRLLAFSEWKDECWTVRVAPLPDFKIRTLEEHPVEPFLAWSRKGDRLAFCNKDHIVIWHSDTEKSLVTHVPEGQPSSLSWVGATDSIVFIVNGQEIWTLDTVSGKRKRIVSAADIVLPQHITHLEKG